MEIIVNHLTRMAGGYVCIAGMENNSNRHIRPVLPGGTRLSTTALKRNGGPFDMAMLVDLGTVKPVPVNPEVEDHEFTLASSKSMMVLTPIEFWKLLKSAARGTFTDIFGPDLLIKGKESCGVTIGHGSSSLGCFLPPTLPELYLGERDGKNKIRIKLSDGSFNVDLSVTDIRMYKNDHLTPNEKIVNLIRKKIMDGINVILSVGLTRPFVKQGGDERVHWLQVNNIHTEDDPIWQLR